MKLIQKGGDSNDGLSVLMNDWNIYINYKLMRVLWIITLYILLAWGSCKRIRKVVSLNTLRVKPQTVFITKFDIGIGNGQFNVKYKKLREQGDPDDRNLKLQIGLLKDDNYHNFKQLQTCEQKIQLYSNVQNVVFVDSFRGSKTFQINETQHEHIWYLFVFDCDSEGQKKQLTGSLQFDVTMWNNGNHFGADEEYFLIGYIVLVIMWLGLIFTHFKPIAKAVQVTDDWTRLLVYGGFICLGVAYLYRFLDVLMISYDGSGISFLSILYECIKQVVMGIVTTVFVAIAWGWSLTHLRHDPYYIIMGTITTLLSVASSIIQSFTDEMEYCHHPYDRTTGLVLLFLRVVICLVFFIGILRSLASSVGKMKYFVKKFARQGGAFLLSWPASVLFVELFLPNYMHKEVVTVVQQGAHLIAIAYICRLFSIPDNEYKKVNIRNEDSVMLDFVK